MIDNVSRCEMIEHAESATIKITIPKNKGFCTWVFKRPIANIMTEHFSLLTADGPHTFFMWELALTSGFSLRRD